ncbi:hypothetical protein BGZ70_005565 [Mortierella alpina]|uniref:CCHC-type domain-containing protein n=1 Tax=Mortierella alpina TaxID=64518 RepID=A0A9P6JB02_MORAP|nr:hypothetical protein BGZ70_005565 [Mortierella alpina]
MNMNMGMGSGMRGNRQGGGDGVHMNAGIQGRMIVCYKCGGPNHFARDCKAGEIKCYNCGKLNHIARDCPNLIGGIADATIKTCYRCGVQGHISRDCLTTKTKTPTSDPDEV